MPGYVLGLDLGSNSVGWACVRQDGDTFENGTPILAGVRVFPEGVANMNQGKEQARGRQRRDARSARRVHYRRRQRRHHLRSILTRAGLLPQDQEALDDLADLDPYRLRARGLDEALEPFEFGRALYHLCHRRGFKSNRKTESNEDNKVTKDANALQAEIDGAACRTLGEYRAHLRAQKPTHKGFRVRGRYTLRTMYEHEFEVLWESQKRFHPHVLTDDLKRQVHETIFFQRPLRFDPDVIGDCELEPGEKRCPQAHWLGQQFRMLQEINHLRVLEDGADRPLNRDERNALAEALGGKKEMSFDQIRTCLDFLDRQTFNLESEGKRKNLKGNAVEAALRRKALRKWYDALPDEKREGLHQALAETQDPEALRRRAVEEWGATEAQADELLKIKLPKGHLRVSAKAIGKMLPFLAPDHVCDEGCRELFPDKDPEAPHVVSEAKQLAGYELQPDVPAFEKLLPLDHDELERVVPSITNPLVRRALGETRKVVNAIVRLHGLPEEIVVELARDMKHSREKRRDIHFDNVRRRNENDEIRKRLQAEFDIANPSRGDVIKYRLWEECGQTCIYTGEPIPKSKLFTGEIQIEHIYPLGRSLDDSYLNKTLCYGPEVNNRKGGKTPYEAYHGTPDYEAILQRAEVLPWKKRRRFAVKEVAFDDFAKRQLNDTRYASRVAARYLRTLGVPVRPVKGQTTSKLGHYWGLYGVLGTDYSKARDDHRYHAVDAIVVALTTRSHLQRLSTVVGHSPRHNPLERPWEGFWENVRTAVDAINVSHRPSRRVGRRGGCRPDGRVVHPAASGSLHKDTGYGPTAKKNTFAYRVPVEGLTPAMIGRIRDGAIQKIVRARLAERGVEEKGSKLLGKVLSEPPLTMPSGVPIKRVRITTVEKTAIPIRHVDGKPVKFVKPGGNHHLEIYNKPDGSWTGRCVSRLEAHHRLQAGEPVVDRRDQPDGATFLMSLCINDMVLLTDHETGEVKLCRVQKISHNPAIDNPDITLRLHWAARIESDETSCRIASWKRARRMAAQKVAVDPLGRVHPCHD